MKYMKRLIQMELLAVILWITASPCMAQQNLRTKRAVSKSAVLPSVSRLSDKQSIIEDVKTRFAKWCQKGEFEKLAAVDGRLRAQSKVMFDRICQEAITSQIRKHSQISIGSNRSISTYDSEKETFVVSFTINGKQVSGEIHVPIDVAQSFKEDFPSMGVTYGKKWVFIGDRLYPKSLLVEDRSIAFSCDLPLGYTGSSDINIAFYELGLSNTYLKGYVFHLGELTDGYESNMEISSPYESKCFDVVEEMPSFPGGNGAMMSYIASNMEYPANARESMIQGRVIVSFVIECDGSISDVRVARSVDPMLDREAMRVVKSMPKWKPGKQNGSAVRVKYTVPVVFRL